MQSLSPDNEREQWKTSLWLGDDSQEEVVFTGASLASLKEGVAQWLESNQPTYISNEPTGRVGPLRRRLYAYCASPQPATELFPHLRQSRYRGYSVQRMDLAVGWHCTYFMRESSNPQDQRPVIQAIGDKAALIDAIQFHIVVWCGSDYVDLLVENGRIVLERVMTVIRSQEMVEVNDMLGRGWRLIALEMNGSQDEMGRLVSQSVTFVLGHPEAGAA